MQWLVVLSALLAVAAASDKAYGGGYAGGKCSRDGFFYHSERAFTICSNGNAYIQPCAPGTRNSGTFKAGHYASAHSFCDVNLVDHGYAVKNGGYGYGKNYGYGAAGYGKGYGGYGGFAGYGGHGNNLGYGAGYGKGYGGYAGYGGYGNNYYGYGGYGNQYAGYLNGGYYGGKWW